MKLDKEFSKRLIAKRKSCKLSQGKLGEMIGVSQSSIAELELIKEGEVKTSTFLPELAYALEWTLEELLGYEKKEDAISEKELQVARREMQAAQDLIDEAALKLSSVSKTLGK